MTKNENVRLFISIEPSPELIDVFKNLISILRENTKGSYTRYENIHLTLAFIGEVEKDKIEIIKGVIDSVSFKPFEIKLSEAGRFKRYGGDIFWIGFESNETLNKISEDLKSKLSAKNFDIDRRKFKPHITLGRKIRYSSSFEDLMQKINNENLLENKKMKVTSYSLTKSEVINGKRVYTDIYTKNSN